MAQFDETKVINALHIDKAEVGKYYYYGNQLLGLKHYVIDDVRNACGILIDVSTPGNDDRFPFIFDGDRYQFIYPYEEPPKKRMTYRQFSEWLAKGNGEYSDSYIFKIAYFTYSYAVEDWDKEVADVVKIRTWDSEEWIEPTVDIYERDCKTPKIYVDKGF